LTLAAAYTSCSGIMPAVTEARLVAAECDCSMVVAAASKATVAREEFGSD
jgi:hypothetical protein